MVFIQAREEVRATHARTARAVQGRGDCSVVVVGTSEVDAASLHSELSRMLA